MSNLLDKIAVFEERAQQLEELIADPRLVRDRKAFAEVARELAEGRKLLRTLGDQVPAAEELAAEQSRRWDRVRDILDGMSLREEMRLQLAAELRKAVGRIQLIESAIRLERREIMGREQGASALRRIHELRDEIRAIEERYDVPARSLKRVLREMDA